MSTAGVAVIISRATVLRTALLWALLEALAAWQVRSADGGPLFLSWVRTVVRPLSWSAERLGALSTDILAGTADLRRVILDNRRLRFELEATRARQRVLEEDLAALREAELMIGEAAEYGASAIAARCAFRDLGAGTMEVRTANPVRLRRDVPAVAAGGLVGRVIRSEGRRHWLQLITHAAAAAAVQTPDARVQALVLGSGGESLAVAYVPRQARLERAAVLMTSGGDGIFPPGIPAARVVRVRETNEPFLEIGAEPMASLRSLRVVVLLADWSPAGPGAPP